MLKIVRFHAFDDQKIKTGIVRKLGKIAVDTLDHLLVHDGIKSAQTVPNPPQILA
jgi:hypothetical protein